MATYYYSDGTQAGSINPPNTTPTENETFILRNIVDLSKISGGLLVADIVECVAIPAGTTVLTAWVRTITAGSSTCRFTVGYGLNASIWAVSALCDAINAVVGIAVYLPKYFSAADTVDVTGVVATNFVGKYEVSVLCHKSLAKY